MSEAERKPSPSLFLDTHYLRRCVRFHDQLVDVLDDVLSSAVASGVLAEESAVARGLELLDQLESEQCRSAI